ncbi:hypothetical protein [Streptomyces megasporus]|uniref:hypothetical protein n=1 Tax=Streptomyces megasporus TaxID=44060 RepID=UPI0004E1F468|nr:hypothetical protein [Streptomyces megasporus]
MAQRTTAPSPRPGRAGRTGVDARPHGGASGVLLALLALLLGGLAPSVAAVGGTSRTEGAHGAPAAGDPGSPASLASLPYVVAAPCAVGCERPPLLYRDAAGERHAAHPGGATLPGRAHPPRPTRGARPSEVPPDAAGNPPHTKRHPGRAPPSPPGP